MNRDYFNNDESKKKMDKVFPILIGVALMVILVTTIMAITKGQNKKGSASTLHINGKKEEEKDNTLPSSDKQVLGVIKEINKENNNITLYDIKNKKEIVVNYTNGTLLYDKYEQAIVLEQLELGEMVDAYYNPDNFRLDKVQVSNQAWTYKEASNWSIDTIDRIFTIGDDKFKYSKNVFILSNNAFLNPDDLHEKDQLTVKGFEKEVYSIQVTKGHGTITLEDFEDFIGGVMYVGNDAILPITEEVAVTVREGNYEVTLEHGSLKGTKIARVGRNQNVTLNMGEFRKPAVKTGLVSFEILPGDAELYIDEELQTYNEPIPLEYGEHTIKVSLEGYETYENMIQVDEASKRITIELEVLLDDSEIDEPYDDNESEDMDQEEDEDTDFATGTNKGKEVAGQLIYVLQPEGASVYLDGEFKGMAPVSFNKITGNHYITLIKNGYETKTYTIEVTDDKEDVYFNFPDMLKK